MQVPWANLPGVDEIDISKFSALAQFDFWLQVQQHYTTHNTSATIELTEDEIVPLGKRIYQAIDNNEGYVSAALLARFNSPYPRLPFQPISNDVYRYLANCVKRRRKSDDFHHLVEHYHRQSNALDSVSGPAPCDSDKCLI
jgi:ribonucleotide reductase class II